MDRSAPPFRRAPRVQDPDAVRPEPRHLRDVRVPVYDRVTPGEPCRKPRLSSRRRTGDVDDADPRPFDLHDPLLRQRLAQRGLVHVPVHGVDRRKRAQLLEHREHHEVAGVHDQVGDGQLCRARVRKPPRAARQVCVGDDRDAGRQPTRNGDPTKSAVRDRFIEAANRTA